MPDRHIPDRHRFHSLCPYFAMFPETFARKHLRAAKKAQTILDPFCGRGTTLFEALLEGRDAVGIDTNPVAVCVSRAKTNPPRQAEIHRRLDELEESFRVINDPVKSDEFFRMCFSKSTLNQVLWLRSELRWRRRKTDCFIAAMVCGRLHGESHKSSQVFSNRMPRTIATKPGYSVRWWKQHGYTPPKRDIFQILHEETDFRFASSPPEHAGKVAECDARAAAKRLPKWKGAVDLMITSPPYLDVTHFREDQWLRVWFLGGDSRPCRVSDGDDRHVAAEDYWSFLEESWRGVEPLLKPRARIVIRIGGKKLNLNTAKQGLTETLTSALGKIRCASESVSEIKRGQLRSFRPNAVGIRREFDFVFERR